MKQTILSTINAHATSFKELSLFIGNHPELGNEEFKASNRLIEAFEHHGFHVDRELLGLKTAFMATHRAGNPGPVIAFFCEYDALPGLGHACGHHLIASMGLAAAVGLKSVVDEIGGVIRVYGTPAEESDGAKAPMSKAGLFDDVDAAMMVHPFYCHRSSSYSLARNSYQFDFYGKPAHAAAAPHEGINALDAVIQLFNAVNALRLQLQSDSRIHGIIPIGGAAANIITEHARAQFSIRSASRSYTDTLVEKVKNCAEGAALQIGCTLEMMEYRQPYDELSTNNQLSELYNHNLCALGVDQDEIKVVNTVGSLDFGNVSHRCPAIHPYVKIMEEVHMIHTPSFRELARKDRALEGMILGAKAMASTAYDVITTPELLQAIKNEFNTTTKLRSGGVS